MVKNAKNKDELDLARSYRTLSDIINKVNKLTNESVKNELQKELEQLSLLLDDIVPPSVNIEDGAILSKKTTVIVTDHNEVVIKLKKDNGEFTTITNNYLIEEEGVYELVVVDAAFNEITIKFTVDLVAPIIYIERTYYNTDVNVVISDLTFAYAEVKKDNDEPINKHEATFTLTEEGSYTLTAFDKAGHGNTISFVIDKTSPVITLKKYNAEGENTVVAPGVHDYSLLATINDENIDTIKLNDSDYVSGTLISEEGTYELIATDKAGNSTVINFVIDKTEPIVVINNREFKGLVENTVYYNSSVTPIINEDNLDSITLNGNDYEVGTEITEEGSYTLIVKDSLGHTTTLNFVIDKTSPVVTLKKYTRDNKGNVVEPGVYNFSLAAFVTDENIDTIKLNDNDYVEGTEISNRLSYTLVVTDKAGNTTTVNFAIDKDHPEVKINNNVYKKTVTNLVFDDYITPIITDKNIDTITLNGENFVSGTEIKDPGNYVLIAKDKAGNTTKVEFEINLTLVSNIADFKSTIAQCGVIHLENDITLDEQIDINCDTTLVGGRIIRASRYTGSLFTVAQGVTFNMRDVEIDGNNNWMFKTELYNNYLTNGTELEQGENTNKFITIGYIGDPIAQKDMFVVNGKLVLNNVTIKNHDGISGASVIEAGNSDAEIIMNNTVIKHCTTPQSSTIVSLEKGGKLTINAGTEFTGNHSGGNGSLIRANGSAVITMNDGKVTNNTSVNGNGTFLMVWGGAKFIMHGGIISNNSGLAGVNNHHVGVVYIHNNSSAIINGGTISDNTGYDMGGIIATPGCSLVEINGGSIINNKTYVNTSFKDIYAVQNKIKITGGTFTQDVSSWVTDTKKVVNNNGTYTVVDK